MDEIIHFVAVPFDLTDQGLVAGRPYKCANPGEAIECAKGYWKVFGLAGAIAFVHTGQPAKTTVLRRFGSVPDDLPV